MASVRRDVLVITIIVIIGLLLAMPLLTLTGNVRTVPFTLSIVASLAAIVFAWRVGRAYGSMVSMAMKYMRVGVIFLAAIQAVMLIYLVGGVPATDQLRTWNNVMFLVAVIMFAAGMHHLTGAPAAEKRMSWKDRISIGAAVLLFLLLIVKRETCVVIASAVMTQLTQVYVFNAIGLIFAVYVAVRALQLHRHLGRTVTGSVGAFIASMLLLAGMQLWIIAARLLDLTGDVRAIGAMVLLMLAMLALVEAFRRMTAAVAVDGRGS